MHEHLVEKSLGADFVFTHQQYQAQRRRMASIARQTRESQVSANEIDTSAGATYAVRNAQTLSFER
jgi:hypothetical protein